MSTKMIKKLKLKESIMKTEKIPIVNEKTILKEALEEMNKYEIGISCVVNTQGKLIGIITDGDIRRGLLKNYNLNDKIEKICNKKSFYTKKIFHKCKLIIY